jgi:hypothetical protein
MACANLRGLPYSSPGRQSPLEALASEGYRASLDTVPHVMDPSPVGCIEFWLVGSWGWGIG